MTHTKGDETVEEPLVEEAVQIMADNFTKFQRSSAHVEFVTAENKLIFRSPVPHNGQHKMDVNTLATRHNLEIKPMPNNRLYKWNMFVYRTKKTAADFFLEFASGIKADTMDRVCAAIDMKDGLVFVVYVKGDQGVEALPDGLVARYVFPWVNRHSNVQQKIDFIRDLQALGGEGFTMMSLQPIDVMSELDLLGYFQQLSQQQKLFMRLSALLKPKKERDALEHAFVEGWDTMTKLQASNADVSSCNGVYLTYTRDLKFKLKDYGVHGLDYSSLESLPLKCWYEIASGDGTNTRVESSLSEYFNKTIHRTRICRISASPTLVRLAWQRLLLES